MFCVRSGTIGRISLGTKNYRTLGNRNKQTAMHQAWLFLNINLL